MTNSSQTPTKMIKQKSLRRYVLKVQTIVALIIVLSYTSIVLYYFIHGLDEANFQDLHLESNHFSEQYNQGITVSLPDSIHFKGYLAWNNLPLLVKTQFPKLEHTTQLSMQSSRVINENEMIAWPEKVLFIIAQPLNDGNTFYLVRSIKTELYDTLGKNGIIKMVSLTWPVAVLFLLIMHLSVHLLLKRTLRPFNQLGDWVDTLNLTSLDNEVPNFEFNELNRIAQQQQFTLKRIRNMICKEQDFLRHASHEMRTPIAVIKSNSELLSRILINNKTEEKSLVSVARINRAALNMQHMTETLLWLSRESEDVITLGEVNIAKMIEQLIEDNQYLLQGKSIEINLSLSNQMLTLAETPCRLVFNNLIRNAFQYTASGSIDISFTDNKFFIKNINEADNSIDHTGADYGYGLGLRLVEKIVQKMHWHYMNTDIVGGRSVTIDFNALK